MPTVEIYTQPFCPYCARAIRLLNEKGVDYTEIDAPNGSAARQTAMERSSGRTSVPQIFINGHGIGGCDELMALNHAGKLDEMLAA